MSRRPLSAPQPKSAPAQSQLQQQRTKLVRRRAQLLDLPAAQRLQANQLALPRRCHQAQLQQLRHQIAGLDQRAQKLEAIIGAGPITASGMPAEPPVLGALNHRQAAPSVSSSK